MFELRWLEYEVIEYREGGAFGGPFSGSLREIDVIKKKLQFRHWDVYAHIQGDVITKNQSNKPKWTKWKDVPTVVNQEGGNIE